MDNTFSYKCFCCSKIFYEKPWMIVKNHNEGENNYNTCSHTCSTKFTLFTVNKKSIFNRKDITSGYDIEKVREEIYMEQIENEQYEKMLEEYTSSEDEYLSE